MQNDDKKAFDPGSETTLAAFNPFCRIYLFKRCPLSVNFYLKHLFFIPTRPHVEYVPLVPIKSVKLLAKAS